MKNCLKQIFLMILAFSLIVPSTAFASPKRTPPKNNTIYISNKKQPPLFKARGAWTGIDFVDLCMNFGKWGITGFTTIMDPSSGKYYSIIKMYVQRYKNGKWNTLEIATSKDTSTNMCSTRRCISKGYYYRTKNIITIYKSKGGKQLNCRTFYYKRYYK